MSDEIIDIDSKTTDEKKSREERKANGRYAAVIVAVIIILLAIYHAWIRKTAVLAGILVPALIMILYGGWVIFLTKRDKKRRQLIARQLEENARLELAEQAAIIAASKITKVNEKRKKHHHHHHHHQNHHHNLLNNQATAVHQKSSLNNINSSVSSTAAVVAAAPTNDISSNNSGAAVTDSDSTGHIITKTAAELADHQTSNDLGDNNNKYRKRKHKRIRTNISSHGDYGGASKRPSFRQRLLRSNNQQTDMKTNKNLRLPPFLCRTNSAP